MPSTQSVGQLQPAWHIHNTSYSPKPYFPSINCFSCIPDQQPGAPRAAGFVSSDAGGQISWISSFRWKPEDNPPIPHSESGPVIPISCFVPPLNFKVESHSCQPLQALQSALTILNTQVHALCSQGNLAASSLHSSNVFPEWRLREKKKKKKKRIQKNLTSHLRKERRNAENEPTNIKTQEAAF